MQAREENQLPHLLPSHSPVHPPQLSSLTACSFHNLPYKRAFSKAWRSIMREQLTAIQKLSETKVKLRNFSSDFYPWAWRGRLIRNKARIKQETIPKSFQTISFMMLMWVPLAWVWLACQQNPFYTWFCCNRHWYCIHHRECWNRHKKRQSLYWYHHHRCSRGFRNRLKRKSNCKF